MLHSFAAMNIPSFLWRAAFIAGGVLISVGAPMHPGGDMVDMLRDPLWPTSHALMTAGFFLLALGWWRVSGGVAPDDHRWALVAALATAVQGVDYVVHTLAFLDAEAVAAGTSAPIFSLHMILTPVLNPIYGLLMVGVIWHFQTRVGPGSVWIGWIGVVGAVGHAAANLLVAGFGLTRFRFLFPFLAFLALWHLLAGVTPARGRRGAPAG